MTDPQPIRDDTTPPESLVGAVLPADLFGGDDTTQADDGSPIVTFGDGKIQTGAPIDGAAWGEW